MTTDHTNQIRDLRTRARLGLEGAPGKVSHELAADLLEMHDATGISLDNWHAARTFVETYAGPITPNGV